MIVIEKLITLNPILLAFLATLFTYFLTLLGSLSVYLFNIQNKKILDLMLGFSGGIMIAASFYSLLNPAVELLEELSRSKVIETSLGFLCGGLFMMICECLLKRSTYQKDKKSHFLLISSITLHNIPEGMAIGVAFGNLFFTNTTSLFLGAIMLALGIGLQNFPEGMCVSLPLLHSGESKKKAFFIGQCSGLVEPIAGVIGALFTIYIKNSLPFLLSFSAGAMIIVVTSELIPEAMENNKKLTTLGLILGFITMMVFDLSF